VIRRRISIKLKRKWKKSGRYSSGREFDLSLIEERESETPRGDGPLGRPRRAHARSIPAPAGLRGSTSDACCFLAARPPRRRRRSDVPLAHSWQPIHAVRPTASAALIRTIGKKGQRKGRKKGTWEGFERMKGACSTTFKFPHRTPRPPPGLGSLQ
jgi:hypothetical protein